MKISLLLKNSYFTLLLSILFFYSSCDVEELIDDIKNKKLVDSIQNLEIALPVGHSIYTARELFTSAKDDELIVKTEQDSALLIVYEDSALLQGKNVMYRYNEFPPASYSFPLEDVPTSTSIQQKKLTEQVIELEYITDAGQTIDSVDISKLQYVINFSSTARLGVEFFQNIEFLNHKKNGQTLKYISPTPIIGSKTIYIDSIGNPNTINTKINLVQKNNRSYIQIKLSPIIRLDPGESILSTQKYTVTITVKSINYKVMYGYFGNNTKIRIAIKSNTFDGIDDIRSGFFVKEPSINYVIQNSYGISFEFPHDSIVLKYPDGRNPLVTGDVTTPKYSIIKEASSIGNVATTTFSVNNVNSSLNGDLEFPTELVTPYNVIILNQGLQQEVNFITPNSFIKIKKTLELPLRSVLLKDSKLEFPFNVGNLQKQIKSFSTIRARITSYNQLPLNAKVKLGFYSDSITLLYETESRDILANPNTNNNGRPTETRQQTTDFPINEPNILQIIKNNTQIIKVTLDGFTPGYDNKTFVKVLADSELQVFVGISGKYTIK
ncbi:MAG: hypothetical protein QM536_03685 [Chitinophagaceae bacterium]|nr:hypothetical protein [Chitinophagaceae bacterium]